MNMTRVLNFLAHCNDADFESKINIAFALNEPTLVCKASFFKCKGDKSTNLNKKIVRCLLHTNLPVTFDPFVY